MGQPAPVAEVHPGAEKVAVAVQWDEQVAMIFLGGISGDKTYFLPGICSVSFAWGQHDGEMDRRCDSDGWRCRMCDQ